MPFLKTWGFALEQSERFYDNSYDLNISKFMEIPSCSRYDDKSQVDESAVQLTGGYNFFQFIVIFNNFNSVLNHSEIRYPYRFS